MTNRPTPPSQELFARAQELFPGGVTAAARLDPALGHPFYASRGEGPYVYDQEGSRYIDLDVSFGATILGHGHPTMIRKGTEALQRGVLCAYEVEEQTNVAAGLVANVPAMEKVRFTCSGTETTWHAIRTARVATGRHKVVKFEGHFHGYNDYLGFSSQPTVAGFDVPAKVADSAGIPPALADYLIVLPFNDVEALEQTLTTRGQEIAAVICEPVSFNAGCLRPLPGYLERMRELTTQQGIVLIFDEILSNFRTGLDCMQGYLGVTPDMCTLGKAVGAGMPLSAFGGKRWVMESVAPAGKAVHSGTYNGHPLLMAGAAAFLEEATRPDFYPSLLAASERLWSGLRGIFAAQGVKAKVSAVGARGCILFGIDEDAEVVNYRQALARNRDTALKFCAAAHASGVHMHSGWHMGTSSAHTPEVVDDALDRLQTAARTLASEQ